MLNSRKYDVLILGSGVSGLYSALNLDSNLDVLLISKAELKLSNSSLAQGGVAAVLDKENVINIKHISSLNFRIAHNVIDCSNFLLKYILNIETGEIYNTLIVSSPGMGKTTILKDLIKKISNGIEEIKFKGQDVSVIDERGELSAMYEGDLQNDLGIRTDVIQNMPKALGIKMCIRAMAPKVIAADEIGNVGEAEAIKNAFCSGVKGIFTAHGDSFSEICLNSELNNLLKNCLIEKIIFLDKNEKGKLKYVYELDKENKQYVQFVEKGTVLFSNSLNNI